MGEWQTLRSVRRLISQLRAMGLRRTGYELLPPYARHVYVVTPEEFSEVEAALTRPVRPTPSIVRGAALSRKIYGKRPAPPSNQQETR